MKRSFFARAAGAALLLCSLPYATVWADELVGIDSDPLLVTARNPQDPLYANAGANLRTGVGSIFVEFNGIPVGGFICTASAISPRHILTAAHCVLESGDSVRRIRFVLSAGQPSPLLLDAVGFTVHPDYEFFLPFLGAFAHGDVAVIELAADLPAGVETYELYTGSDEFGQTARHYGHGRSGTGNKGATGPADFFYGRTGLNRYEQVLEPFLGTGIEDQLLHDFDSGGRKHNAMEWWFTSRFACHPENPNNPPQAQDGQCSTFKDGSYPDFKGFGNLETGVAPGDSGGPSFIDGKIAGVHSFGFTHFCEGVTNGTDFTCGLDSSYGEMSGDTRVSYYAGWIAGAVGNPAERPIPELPPLAAPVEPATAPAAAATNARAREFMSNTVSGTMRARF
ncbi:MAG: trypsin-like serine protease [Pseudomonadales bacterium]